MSATPKATTDVDRLVGLRITTLRKARGLSQTALGTECGVTFQQIQKYEKGQNRVGAGRLQEIARVLDAPVAAFFGGGAEGQDGALAILAEPGAIEWLRAFAAISSPEQRRALLAMAKTLAGTAVTAEAA